MSACWATRCVVAHHNDMGGRVPGSSAADSTEIFQEGLRIPILKLYERGVPNQTLLDMIALNVRIPDVVLGDLQAQEAACRIAERGMGELAERYGVDELEHYFEELLDYSEREARRTVRLCPAGDLQLRRPSRRRRRQYGRSGQDRGERSTSRPTS